MSTPHSLCTSPRYVKRLSWFFGHGTHRLIHHQLLLAPLLALPLTSATASQADQPTVLVAECKVYCPHTSPQNPRKDCYDTCYCNQDVVLQWGSSTNRDCYEGDEKCLCIQKKAVQVQVDKEVAAVEPSKTKAAVQAWPSILKCPDNMPLFDKKQCWERRGCVKASGKVYLDGTLQACKDKFYCAEEVLTASDEEGEVVIHEAQVELFVRRHNELSPRGTPCEAQSR